MLYSSSYRVLKPPGGGSSDIFGTTSSDEVNPHKRGTNQKNLQSSIILGGQSPKHGNGTATNGNSDKPGNFINWLFLLCRNSVD